MTVPFQVDALPLRDKSLLRSNAYIGGQWVGANHGVFAVSDPSDQSVISTVTDMQAHEVAEVIAIAERAQTSWAALPAKQRALALRRWFDLIIVSEQDLARIITAEQGKPLSEALAEVRYGAGFVEWFAEEAKRIYGETIPAPSSDRRIIVLKQPIGVAAAITPWNFPLAMITRKAGAALAAGCAIVVKPAELTPLTALALAEISQRAGIPAGIFNVITCSDAAGVGRELCSNSSVRALSFTGSTEVGRLLLRQSADTVKKCSMELGGNAPILVFDDAGLQTSVRGVFAAKFRNGGQSCIAANRILVQSSIYDAFAEQLSEACRELVVGPGAREGVTIGPLIDSSAIAKVEEHVADAVRQGAQIRIGGSRHELGGTFFEPTVLTGVTSAMKIFQGETFGPVAALIRFDTEEEAITLANDSQFGLAAYLFTRDVGRCVRVAEALQVGIVGINEGLISTEVAPFGGVKQSGLGREGSRHGIEEYLQIKYICLGNV